MLKQDLSVEDRAAEWLISDAGYKRFLKWEKIFTEHALAGVPAHLAASRAAWADAMLETQSIDTKAV
jgi:hypothetical protein